MLRKEDCYLDFCYLSHLRTPVDYGIKINGYEILKDVIIGRNTRNNDV